MLYEEKNQEKAQNEDNRHGRDHNDSKSLGVTAAVLPHLPYTGRIQILVFFTEFQNLKETIPYAFVKFCAFHPFPVLVVGNHLSCSIS